MFRQTFFYKLACCTLFRCRPLWTNNAILMQFDIYNLLKLVNINLWLEAPSLTVWAYRSNTDIFTKDVIHSLNEWFNYRGVCRYICLNICVFCLKWLKFATGGKLDLKIFLTQCWWIYSRYRLYQHHIVDTREYRRQRVGACGCWS